MRRLRLLALGSLGVLAACTPPDSALRVNVTVRAQGTAKVRADCLKLLVLDEGGAELKSLVIARPADDTAVFAVRRGSDLPGTVKLRVDGFLGTCSDEATLKLNAQSSVETGVFPESGFTALDLTLDPAGPSLDGDRDGFVAGTKGGPDCRDDDATIFPGAGQVCGNTNDTDCDGQGGCDDSECGAATACVNPPDRVVVTANYTSMLRYECRLVHVELHNAAGTREAVRDTLVTLTSSLPGTTLHATSNCTETPITSLPIPVRTLGFDVYLKADPTAFGTTTITATAAQVATPGTLAIEVHPQPVDHVVFTTPARTQTAGLCGAEPVTIEFQDVQNRRTDVDSDTTVQLSSTPGDLANANIFFSDSACANAAAAPMLTAGQGTLTVYVLAKRATTFTLRAAPSVGTADTQMLVVQPSAAAKLAFLNQPLALVTTQTCSSGSLDLELQDEFDNHTTMGTDLQVRVSVTGLTAVTFSALADATCAVAGNDYVVPASTGRLQLRAAASSAASGNMGTVRVAPLSAVNITAAQQDLFVAAGPPSRYTWDGTAQTPLAGVCSANPLTLRITDSTGNTTSSPTPITITLSTLPGADASFGFFSNAGCVTPLTGNTLTIPANQTSAQVYFRGNRVMSSFEVRANSTLSGPTTPATGNAIRPNVPAKLVYLAPTSQTVQAGSCSPSAFQAEVRDQYDNVTSFTAPQMVSVASSPPGVTVGNAPTCDTASAVPLAAGASVVNFNARHTITNTYSLTATVTGFSTVPAATLTVTPGPATLQVDNPVGTSVLTAGGCQTVTLTRRDSIGPNNAPLTGNNPVTLSFPASTTWNVYTSNNCTTGLGGAIGMNNTHTVTFSVSPQRATGPLAMTATVASQTATVNFQVSPGAPTLVFEAPATGTPTATATQTAGGCTRVAVARRDSFLNDVPTGMDGGIAISMVAGTTAHAESTCDAGSALTFVPVASTDSRGQFWVRATASAPTGGPQAQTVSSVLQSQTATLTLTVNPGAPTLRLSDPVSGSASVQANTCVPVTIERRDPFNNLVPISTGLNITLAPVTGGVYEGFATANCTGGTTNTIPMTGGTSSRQFSVRSTRAGTQNLSITLDGQTVPLVLNVSPGPLNKLLVEGLPTITARGCQSGVVVRRQDQWNNDITADPTLTVALSSARYGFSTDMTCAGATSPLNVTIPVGSAVSSDTVYVTATVAGSATVTANSVPAGATGSATGTVNPGAAHHLSFLSTPSPVTAGQCSTSLVLELRDQDENRITPAAGSPLTVGLTSTNAVTFFNAASCTGGSTVQLTNAAPTATFSFRPTVATSNEIITASVTSGATFTAPQTWTVTAAAASKLAWKTNPTTPVTRFACASAGVLQATDAFDNLVATGGVVTVTPTTTGTGGVTFYSDATCTTPLSTFTINSTIEGPEFYFQATGVDPSAFSATATSFTGAPAQSVNITGSQGSLAITPASPIDLEASACVALTVTRRDDLSNPLTTGTTAVTASVPGGTTALTLHTDANCTSATTTSVSGTIAHGQSTMTLYARGRSASAATDVTLTAAAGGSTSGTATLRAYPLVRRGDCSLADAQNSVTCALTPAIPGNDLSRSFVVFSSTGRPVNGGNLDAADQAVECHLETGGVVCSRAGTNGAMSIKYQVVSFGRDAATGGVSVQHYQFNTSAAVTNQPITAVDTAKSFILTSNTMSGNLTDGDAFPVVTFNGSSSVDVTANTGTPTRKVAVQVVTLGGTAAVDHRLVTSGFVQTNGQYTVTTSNLTNAIALAQVRLNTDSTDVGYMCKRRFNTKVASNTSVTVKRGGVGTMVPATCTTDAPVTIAVQRIGFGSLGTVRTPSADATFNNNTNPSADSGTFTAVTTHRSIVLLMTQGPGGQTAGESNAGAGVMNPGNSDDDTSPFHATLDFNATFDRVTVTRTAPASATARFSPIVVQFDP